MIQHDIFSAHRVHDHRQENMEVEDQHRWLIGFSLPVGDHWSSVEHLGCSFLYLVVSSVLLSYSSIVLLLLFLLLWLYLLFLLLSILKYHIIFTTTFTLVFVKSVSKKAFLNPVVYQKQPFYLTQGRVKVRQSFLTYSPWLLDLGNFCIPYYYLLKQRSTQTMLVGDVYLECCKQTSSINNLQLIVGQYLVGW